MAYQNIARITLLAYVFSFFAPIAARADVAGTIDEVPQAYADFLQHYEKRDEHNICPSIGLLASLKDPAPNPPDSFLIQGEAKNKLYRPYYSNLRAVSKPAAKMCNDLIAAVKKLQASYKATSDANPASLDSSGSTDIQLAASTIAMRQLNNRYNALAMELTKAINGADKQEGLAAYLKTDIPKNQQAVDEAWNKLGTLLGRQNLMNLIPFAPHTNADEDFRYLQKRLDTLLSVLKKNLASDQTGSSDANKTKLQSSKVGDDIKALDPDATSTGGKGTSANAVGGGESASQSTLTTTNTDGKEVKLGPATGGNGVESDPHALRIGSDGNYYTAKGTEILDENNQPIKWGPKDAAIKALDNYPTGSTNGVNDDNGINARQPTEAQINAAPVGGTAAVAAKMVSLDGKGAAPAATAAPAPAAPAAPAPAPAAPAPAPTAAAPAAPAAPAPPPPPAQNSPSGLGAFMANHPILSVLGIAGITYGLISLFGGRKTVTVTATSTSTSTSTAGVVAGTANSYSLSVSGNYPSIISVNSTLPPMQVTVNSSGATANVSIPVTLSCGPPQPPAPSGSCTLSGNTTVTATNGVANFTGITVTAASGTVGLTFNAPGAATFTGSNIQVQ